MFVFEPVNKERDLFTVKAMHSICKFQDELIDPKSEDIGLSYCHAASIPNTIAEIHKIQCHEITQVHLDSIKNLIETCGKLAYGYANGEAAAKPQNCTDLYAAIRDILINLAQIGYFNTDTEKIQKLKYTAVYMRGFYVNQIKFFHDNLEKQTVGDDQVKISAVKFNIHKKVKATLLSEYVISDLMYFAIALVLVFFVMFLYLRSVVLLLSMLVNVIVSFATAYFLYHVVFGLRFYPYLNLLAGLVLIAVGADDVFIMNDCWEHARARDPHAPMQKILEETLHHSALSVFVTSLTTSSAFFANALTSIMAVKNYAIFAGISILANLFYMMTLTPAVLVCIEWCYRFFMKYPKFQELDTKANNMTAKLHELSVVIFHRNLPMIVNKTWFLWIFLLLVLGTGACVVIFVYPKFKLPETKDYQVFLSSNVIQNWDLTMTRKFQSLILNEEIRHKLRFFMIFGIHATDPGNYLDPDDRGDNTSITLDTTFNMSHPDTQTFILETCHKLLKQPFMDDLNMTCHLDAIVDILKVNCMIPSVQMTGCCPTNFTIPIDSALFDECAGAYQFFLLRETQWAVNSTFNFGNILGAFIFKTPEWNDTQVYAYVFDVPTRYIGTTVNAELDEYNTAVRSFLDNRLSEGPEGIQSGFLAPVHVAYFKFFDLQESLASGTFYSIAFSLSVSFLVMLITSRSLLITIYAIVTICLAISCTVAVLVFLGWYLNIVESVIISLAVGLSIDFTIHLGVAYQLSNAPTSPKRTEEGFQRVASAVAMAALTTFLAGAAMMACNAFMYIQFGIFLMLVMTFSWLYANFFFQSICHVIGPSKQCYKTCTRLFCCCRRQSHDEPGL